MKSLCQTADVPKGAARGFSLDSQSYIVVRDRNRFFVYRNQCPHLGLPLEWLPDEFMDADGELLRCATHGALFLPDTGECVAGPCLGQYLIPVAFQISDGDITLTDASANHRQ